MLVVHFGHRRDPIGQEVELPRDQSLLQLFVPSIERPNHISRRVNLADRPLDSGLKLRLLELRPLNISPCGHQDNHRDHSEPCCEQKPTTQMPPEHRCRRGLWSVR